MRRFLLLLLVLPLLAGACGDDATEDTPDPPATTLPAGTRAILSAWESPSPSADCPTNC